MKMPLEGLNELALRICPKSRVFSGGEIQLFATAEQFEEFGRQLIRQRTARLVAAIECLKLGDDLGELQAARQELVESMNAVVRSDESHTHTDTAQSTGQSEQLQYLVNREKKAKTHLWDGTDTLCTMWSTGGLKRESYEVSNEPQTAGICSMCSAASIAK